jgi:hypothetical protein
MNIYKIIKTAPFIITSILLFSCISVDSPEDSENIFRESKYERFLRDNNIPIYFNEYNCTYFVDENIKEKDLILFFQLLELNCNIIANNIEYPNVDIIIELVDLLVIYRIWEQITAECHSKNISIPIDYRDVNINSESVIHIVEKISEYAENNGYMQTFDNLKDINIDGNSIIYTILAIIPFRKDTRD